MRFTDDTVTYLPTNTVRESRAQKRSLTVLLKRLLGGCGEGCVTLFIDMVGPSGIGELQRGGHFFESVASKRETHETN